jgi:hypothetical protein
MGRWIALGLIALALVGFLAQIYLFRPSDEEQIKQALEQSIEASREGQPGGVLDILLRSATFNDLPIDNRREVADTIRRLRPDLTVYNPEPIIDGDEAVIRSDVRVEFGLGPLPDQEVSNVEIYFEQVPSTVYVIFPINEWKVSRVEAPGFQPPTSL